jgi:hypothetical protein
MPCTDDDAFALAEAPISWDLFSVEGRIYDNFGSPPKGGYRQDRASHELLAWRNHQLSRELESIHRL